MVLNYCDRCKSTQPVRLNSTQIRCARCGNFLGRRPKPLKPAKPAAA